MESYRPVNKISRFESVFMVNDPSLVEYAGGYEDFIYEVEPIGQVDRSDLSWYSEIEIYNDPEEREECAKNYWNGIPFTNPANRLWEYRAKEAKIIGMLS